MVAGAGVPCTVAPYRSGSTLRAGLWVGGKVTVARVGAGLVAIALLVGGTPAAEAVAVSAPPSAHREALSVRPSGPYERLCYTPLSRLKTLRASPTRTYSYDALTLQAALVYLDFPPPVPIKIDGWYGPATASAVKAYQRSRQLYVDGVVGRQTWRQLRSELC
jgi:hypothetical protein